MLLFSSLPEMTLYLLFCLQKTELSACFPWQPGAAWPHASSQRNEGSLSADCWVYLRHCHTSLRQFFSFCFHSPLSASLRACGIIFPHHHTPTQSADSLPVVLFLSCFLYLLCTARKKKRGWSHQTVPMAPRPHHCRHQ